MRLGSVTATYFVSMSWKSAFRNCQSGSSYTRSLVGMSTVTGFSSDGPREATFTGKVISGGSPALAAVVRKSHFHFHFAQIGFRMIDYSELNFEMSRALLVHPESHQLDVFGRGVGALLDAGATAVAVGFACVPDDEHAVIPTKPANRIIHIFMTLIIR